MAWCRQYISMTVAPGYLLNSRYLAFSMLWPHWLVFRIPPEAVRMRKW